MHRIDIPAEIRARAAHRRGARSFLSRLDPATTAHVVIDVGGLRVTASITNEAVQDLGLKVGGEATAIVKSSDVIVAVI